jgi:diaminohydroxyphosphoribosylaminopyrimidine deaminase/5-amino-6-(5-phosphoribosylamino)uracil reductase
VSLEPHTHHGRTAPCTEALIDAGIIRVVCPVEDPNPLVSGKGFERLAGAGIEVVTGVLKDEAERLNEKFFCWHRKKRPFVHLKAAVSLDGRIATSSGDSKWITSEASRTAGQSLRHEYDAMLVGAGTVMADDPSLTDRSGLERRRPLVRVVLDTDLRTDPWAQIVTSAKEFPTVLITASEDRRRVSLFEDSGVEVIRIEGGPRNLDGVLGVLREKQLISVLVEGGAAVAGSFLDARLIDKFTFFIAPLVIGGVSSQTSIGGKGAESIASALKLERLVVSESGLDLEITGYVADIG